MKTLIGMAVAATMMLGSTASVMAQDSAADISIALKGQKQMATQADKNKTRAVEFYDMMFNQGKPREAAEKYIGDRYIQHNPFLADGKEPFIEYFVKMAAKYSGKKVEFKRVIAEGNLVVLHSHQYGAGEHEYSVMDIFRFDKNGKIVEHWDVLQIVPEVSQNGNGMF